MPSGRIPDWKRTQAVMEVLHDKTKEELCDILVEYDVVRHLVNAMWIRREENGVQSALNEIDADQDDPWQGRKKRGFIFNVTKTEKEEEAKVLALKENPELKVEEKAKGAVKSTIKMIAIEGFSPGGAKAVMKDLKQ